MADPNTGVWVYDTYAGTGWYIFGGTSVASPIVASVYALAQNGASSAQLNNYPYGQASALNDVTSGSNGSCGTYLCSGAVGYDGPTGLGTPNGVAAFSPPAPPASLSFTTPAQTLTAGVASSSITVQTSGGDATISLTSNSSQGSFSSATLATVNGQASFTYTDTQAGSPALTASATGFAAASQTERVVAAQAVKLTAISPSSASLAVGRTATFTASAADQYGNPADASGTSWSLTGVGSPGDRRGHSAVARQHAAGDSHRLRGTRLLAERFPGQRHRERRWQRVLHGDCESQQRLLGLSEPERELPERRHLLLERQPGRRRWQLPAAGAGAQLGGAGDLHPHDHGCQRQPEPHDAGDADTPIASAV